MKDKDCLFDPRTCTYKLSGKIRDQVDEILCDKNVEKQTRAILSKIMEQEEANKNTLDYESLVKLHKYIQWADPDNTEPFYLFSDSCKCIEPKQRDNKTLDERLKKLRLRSSQAMYERLVSGVDRSVDRKREDRLDKEGPMDSSDVVGNNISDIKNLYGSVTAVFNSFMVVICTFIACYYALKYSLPEPNVTYQAAFGLFGSLIFAIAELYFLFRVV